MGLTRCISLLFEFDEGCLVLGFKLTFKLVLFGSHLILTFLDIVKVVFIGHQHLGNFFLHSSQNRTALVGDERYGQNRVISLVVERGAIATDRFFVIIANVSCLRWCVSARVVL